MRFLRSIIFLIPFNFYAGDKKALDPATVVAIVEELRESSVRVTESGKIYEPSLLEVAVENNIPTALPFLLQVSSVDLNEKDKKGHVLLYRIMEGEYRRLWNREKERRSKHKEMANIIVDHPDFDQKKSGYGRFGNPTYPLDWAVEFDDYIELVPKLLKHKDAIYSYDRFLMKFAPHAHKCGKEICNILMEKEPKFLKKTLKYAIEGYFDLGKKIVSPSLTFLCDNYQIDQSLLDYALYVAVKRRQELCVKFLVERGAEGNHRNKRGGTMLMLSTSHIDRRDITHLCDKIVPLLCKTKFDPQLQKDKEGNTPFHYLFGTHAWEEEEEQCGQALLTLGINPNAVNNKGESALHCFVRQCSKTYRDDEDEDYVLNRWCKNIPKCLAFCEKINLDKGIKDKIGHTAKYYASPVLEKYFNYKE